MKSPSSPYVGDGGPNCIHKQRRKKKAKRFPLYWWWWRTKFPHPTAPINIEKKTKKGSWSSPSSVSISNGREQSLFAELHPQAPKFKKKELKLPFLLIMAGPMTPISIEKKTKKGGVKAPLLLAMASPVVCRNI